jgi:hypothetical protein
VSIGIYVVRLAKGTQCDRKHKAVRNALPQAVGLVDHPALLDRR